MKGGISTKERCALFGGKFITTENDLLCPVHQTSPTRNYVVLYSKELGKHMKLYSDTPQRQRQSTEWGWTWFKSFSGTLVPL